MTKRAILYARVSGDDRKYATSGIESQLADCCKYAGERGYQVVNEFNVMNAAGQSAAVLPLTATRQTLPGHSLPGSL